MGSTKEKEVDVRIIAATHRNLREAAKAGAFREDLLYRLDVISISVPSLREEQISRRDSREAVPRGPGLLAGL